MIKIGDKVIFRYSDDPNSETTPNEWYDFKDEVDYLYGGNYDLETWTNVFTKQGLVKKIHYNIITVHVDGIGEIEGSSKIIKLLKPNKTTFKIGRDLNYAKI